MENHPSRNVVLVEINVFEDMVPLVSGYLQAYACADPALKNNWNFIKYTSNTKVAAEQIADEILAYDCDFFAFSCYIWNMELVKSILQQVIARRPDAYILLGGPQVMHHATEYLDPNNDKMFLCNGEGERTFSNVLRQLMQPVPNFSEVRGISFYNNGVLKTTDPEERITDFSTLPSPFLMGLFDGKYRMTVFETNRGCPFKCAFCFWGAATNDRVYKFDEERIINEISWISQHNIPFIFIADANWGMLKRDIEFSRHMTRCKEEHGLPIYINFSAAKNSPTRVAEITAIFKEADMINFQPISMQSLNEHTLEVIERKNIRVSAYEKLQQDLNDRDIHSFIELIWPLPGETLHSFKKGLEQLFEKQAGYIVVYQHMLLHNTTIFDKRDEYKLQIKTTNDGVAEFQFVIGTTEVDYENYLEGLWFYYMVLSLHNTRRVHRLTRYLHTNGTVPYSDFYSAFMEHCKKNDQHPFTRFCQNTLEQLDYNDRVNYPMAYNISLHSDRYSFDELLHDFVSSQYWWVDEKARVLFEIDVLSKPFIYSNTFMNINPVIFQELKIIEVTNREYTIEVPKRYIPLLERGNELHEEVNGTNGTSLFQLDHKLGQLPFRETQSSEANANYVYGMMMKVATLIPEWKEIRHENAAF